MQLGSTALMWAARKGHLQITQELLKSGANTEAKGRVMQRDGVGGGVNHTHIHITTCLTHPPAYAPSHPLNLTVLWSFFFVVGATQSTNARAHIHIHAYIYTHAHTHIPTQTRTHTYTYTHAHAHTPLTLILKRIHTQTYTRTHAHTHPHIHTRARAHTRTHIHTRTYIFHRPTHLATYSSYPQILRHQ